MVDLRKRKAPNAPAPAAKKAKKEQTSSSDKKARDDEHKAKKVSSTAKAVETSSSASKLLKVGSDIPSATLALQITTQDGTSTTLSALLSSSDTGIIIFTYPKASTPGCTTQACLFRDSYKPLTSSGLSIFGLSNDSPKSNTTFKTKQNLPYDLLCDPKGELIKALGFGKAGGKTARGVVGISKVDEKVQAWEQGGPARTVEVVREAVDAMGGKDKKDVPSKDEVKKSEKKEIKGKS